MLSREWKPAQTEPVFTWPTGAIEDFSVVIDNEIGDYRAYFTAGPTLQDQRLYRVRGADVHAGPLGPFESADKAERVSDLREAHTRLYRGGIVGGPLHGDLIITAVWPGLPRAGIWHFRHVDRGLLEKRLLVAPTPNTQFSVAAANPCILWDGRDYNIIFEGRDERLFWRLFHTTWDGVGMPRTDPRPLFDGANPSFFQYGPSSDIYLYYSCLRNPAKGLAGGFETRAMVQESRK